MLDFLCIGAQKAGTSWLHSQLVRHPQVAFPAGKEAHYWDWVQRGKRPEDIERLIFVIDGCPEDSEEVVRAWMPTTDYAVRVVTKLDKTNGVLGVYTRGEQIKPTYAGAGSSTTTSPPPPTGSRGAGSSTVRSLSASAAPSTIHAPRFRSTSCCASPMRRCTKRKKE